MAKEPEPWEFRAKPAWQRLIVMLGGIIVNVITGVIIFIGLTFFYGDDYISKDEVNKHGVYANEFGRQIGFETGDKVININGKEFENTSDIFSIDNMMENGTYVTIERGGEQKKVIFPSQFMDKFQEFKKENKEAGLPITPLIPFKVGEIQNGTPADKAGLMEGDRIVEINGRAIDYLNHLQEELRKNKEKEVSLVVLRDGKTKELKATLGEKPTLGFQVDNLLNLTHVDYGFAESIPKGTKDAFGKLTEQAKAFKKMFTGEINPLNNLGSFITIGKVYGGTWVWQRFWLITGMLSMVLAFMNLLPIPALDGGHVVFLTYEIIAGKAPSDKFLENSQKIGMLILLTLMVFVIGLDIFRNFIQ